MRSDALVSHTLIDVQKRSDDRITGRQGLETMRDECERPFYTVLRLIKQTYGCRRLYTIRMSVQLLS